MLPSPRQLKGLVCTGIIMLLAGHCPSCAAGGSTCLRLMVLSGSLASKASTGRRAVTLLPTRTASTSMLLPSTRRATATAMAVTPSAA